MFPFGNLLAKEEAGDPDGLDSEDGQRPPENLRTDIQWIAFLRERENPSQAPPGFVQEGRLESGSL